jgi:hypothetical protein
MENLMGCLVVFLGIFPEQFQQMLNLVAGANPGGGGCLE